MVRIFKTLVCLILLSVNLSAQSQNLQFEHLTVENGLSNNSVNCILQDRQDFIWFGTNDGLNRYDGHTFKIFRNDQTDSNSPSNDIIYCVKEDSAGFIWIGSNAGLNKFDPELEKFTRYLKKDNNPNSISDNIINCLYEDSDNNLWIGTEHGLNSYNRKTDMFKRFYFAGEIDSTSVQWNNNRITAISQDHNGLLLVGTMDDFMRFNPVSGMTSIIPDYAPYHPVGDWWPVMSCIYKDSFGKYWIGLLLDGLAVFDSETGESYLYAHHSEDPSSYSADFSHSICEDQNRLLWIASNDGLNIFDQRTEQFTVIKHNSRNEHSISSNNILFVYCDKQGNIWVATDKGIDKLSKWKKPIKHYLYDSEDPSSLASGEVCSICEDRDGNIWTGSYGGGMSCLNRETDLFSHYKLQLAFNQSDFDMVWGLCEDRLGRIWSSYIDINCFDRSTGKMKYYRHKDLDPESHSSTWTYKIYEDREGTLWFGTFGAGLERFNQEEETFTHFKYDPENPHSLSSNDVYAIYQDTEGFLWIGTSNGLSKMIEGNENNGQFIRYQYNIREHNSLSGQFVYAVYEDQQNRLWIGTDQGLNLFDREKESFIAYTEKDGLPSNDIYALLEDDHGNLWLRTKRGLVKFNPQTQSFRTYDERDGLIYCKSVNLGKQAFCKGSSGEMYYGGANSMAVFHPDSLKDNPDPPEVKLTGFQLFNNPVRIGPQSLLKKSITMTREIHLSYDQNSISFEFAALDFTSPRKNQYVFKLEDMDPDWVYCGNDHIATYTNLEPGAYTFRVRGSNNDGVWNEAGASIMIFITPPWWKTGWTYGLYVFLMISAIYGAWRFQLNRFKMRHLLEMEHLQAQRLAEVDRMKSYFFANISHEFRTPLTLILGPLERLLSRSQEEDSRQDIKMMQRSARRLQRLINQLLDLSKLEAGKMKLQVRKKNIVILLRSFVQAFESMAKIKNIKLIFKADPEKMMGYLDDEKLETIINNLLSNAFKFTSEEGKISVTVQNASLSPPMYEEGIRRGSAEYIQISVSDTGSGIPADRLQHVFDRFYQIDDSFSTKEEGTGIGLALTKELIEFHKGAISVSSKIGQGTTFVIRLPIDKKYYTPEEIIDENKYSENSHVSSIFHKKERLTQEEEFSKKSDDAERRTEAGKFSVFDWNYTEFKIKGIELKPKSSSELLASSSRFPVSGLPSPLVLIVEDNPDMRTYISRNLENDYRMMEAADGEEGFNKCAKALPELVISDIMMPRMNGFQLCAKLKTDPRTSHIPVILLTARAAAEDKIGGLETGADDYMIKPFNARELQVRVKNLIEQRRQLHERFSREIMLQPLEIAFTSTDEKFMQRIVTIIEKELSNPLFDVATFVNESGMSRANLYRKLQALCGQSAKEFIRTIRLKRAAQMLAKHSASIAEIAYEVGFNNPSYFSECFRRQFGISPSVYASQPRL